MLHASGIEGRKGLYRMRALNRDEQRKEMCKIAY